MNKHLRKFLLLLPCLLLHPEGSRAIFLPEKLSAVATFIRL